MKSLVRNTVINMFAFGTVSIVGLALVPLIVSAYGLGGLGLLVVARLFLPTGILTMLDLGLSEATTRQVARAAAGDDKDAPDRVAASAIAMAGGIGIVTAALLASAAGPIAGDMLDLTGGDAETFRTLLLWTAAALCLLFPGHIVESWLKGLERFDLVRMAEVGAVLCYAAGTVAAVLLDLSYVAVGYVFLGATLLRFLLLGAFAAGSLGRGFRPYRAEARALLRLGVDFTVSKFLAVAFIQGPPLVIAATIGPAGVGLYDVLMRLPRFAKIAAGTANAAMLPAAAKLDTRGDEAAVERIVMRATVFCVALFMPGFVGGMVFAPDLLRWWLGAEYAGYGAWLALAFAWPMIWQFYQIGSSTVAARPHAVRKLNMVNAMQVGLMFAIAIALLPLLGERAFILGTTAAAALCAPLLIHVFCREYGIRPARFMFGPSKILLAGVIPGVWAAAVVHEGWIEGPVTLAGAFTAWCAIYWLSTWFIGFSADDRTAARRVLAGLLGRPDPGSPRHAR